MPSFVEPQFCRLVDAPPQGDNWVHEVKFDGYRLQLRVEKGKAVLRTRKGLDWSQRFPEILVEAQRLPNAMIDGEVCALSAEGVPDFGALQAALSDGKTKNLIFYAFDLLFAVGEDLRAAELSARKKSLEALLKKARLKHIAFVPHFTASGEAMLQSACRMAMEGIVSKRLDAPYRSGRGDFWTKAKCRPGQEVVIGGWWGDASHLRSILVGAYQGGALAYMGKIGTGFNARNTGPLLKALRSLKRANAPFAGNIKPPHAREIHWVEPKLVAEIGFSNVTPGGLLRQASFKGLRSDKAAREIVWETAKPVPRENTIVEEERTVRKAITRNPAKANAAKPAAKGISAKGETVAGIVITHPDKILWPATKTSGAITKRDLARYYELAAPRLLPYLEGRPVSFVRAPDGITGELFFQRHVMLGTAVELPAIKIKGEAKPYASVDSAKGLVALAQVAVLELHPWGSKPGDPETPERLIFDLDPSPELGFEAVIAAAHDIKARLEALGLGTYVKTTGGKGLHVVTPVKGTPKSPLDWGFAKNFARTLCEHMAADSPALYTTNMSKKQRGGRIFLDYLRNDRTSTAVGAWSPRAREGATIAMPLPWSAIKPGLDPKAFSIANASALLKRKDPWADMAKSAGNLAAARKKLEA